MAVLQRNHPQVQPRTPPDFGLSLIVTAIFGGILLLLLIGATSIPTRGPQGESHAPTGETYIDVPPPSTEPGAGGSTLLPQH
ncbi:MAG: hypothetical protein ABI577_00390 [bacterium]